jgi:hypothetical protein
MQVLRTTYLGVLVASAAAQAAAQQPARALTFAADVAPIVRARCAGCHAPGQAGPFALLGYDDVAKRSRVIADVVARRVMPPWLPDPTTAAVRRRASARGRGARDAARLIGQPGDLAALPPPAAPPSGSSALDPPGARRPAPSRPRPSSATVIPVPIHEPCCARSSPTRGTAARYTTPRSGSPRACAARAPDARPQPGFPVSIVPPDGHFLGWAPGKRAGARGTCLAARAATTSCQMPGRAQAGDDPGRASGSRKEPPARRATAIDAQASTSTFPRERRLRATERGTARRSCVGARVYPHAHYLGEAPCRAELPDGSRR